MTLSRKSRKPSRDRKGSESERLSQQQQPPSLAMVSRDTLADTATEAQARMAIFARSMSPYIQSHCELAKRTGEVANSDLSGGARINRQTVNHWIDSRLRDMTSYNYDTPVRRVHQRKSSISSISSSKSDSNSSGSANPVIIADINEINDHKQRAQSSLAISRSDDYRLSTTSHDSGFTSHEQIDVTRTHSLPRPHHHRAMKKPSFEASTEAFNLPAPPPELLMEPLNVSCPNLERTNSGPQSPSSRSTASSNASIPLSPYMHHPMKPSPQHHQQQQQQHQHHPHHQHHIIESGIATIRRNPSKLRSSVGQLHPSRIPSIPSSPAKPPLPPKRQGSTLSSN